MRGPSDKALAAALCAAPFGSTKQVRIVIEAVYLIIREEVLAEAEASYAAEREQLIEQSVTSRRDTIAEVVEFVLATRNDDTHESIITEREAEAIANRISREFG